MTDDRFLDVRGVSKRFGATTVLDGVDLAMRRGEFVSLLGPSGCGKTTLLRIVAGLLRNDTGTVVLDGADLTRLPAHKRRVGVVFQNYALFPHLSVAENVAFGLKAQGTPKAEIGPAVAQALALVRLADYGDRPVQALSGGQQQRVAVARAIAVKPKLLLLDEPLSALDRKLRETMQIELRRLLRELGITAVFVTHDQDEALVMSDRIAIMNEGVIEQFADPGTIYRRPATPFALEFVGLSTRIHGTVAESGDGRIAVSTAYGTMRAPGTFRPGTRVLLAVRPERLVPGRGADDANRATFRLTDVVFLGSKLTLYFEAAPGEQILAEVNPGSGPLPEPGREMTLSWSAEDTLVYPWPGEEAAGTGRGAEAAA